METGCLGRPGQWAAGWLKSWVVLSHGESFPSLQSTEREKQGARLAAGGIEVRPRPDFLPIGTVAIWGLIILGEAGGCPEHMGGVQQHPQPQPLDARSTP